MADYDAIVIGAGHNGLVCAALLARAGQRVLVLEAGASPGGLAADREFHPGFRAPVAHSLSHFSATVAQELDLATHGYGGPGTVMPLVGLGRGSAPVEILADGIEGVSATDQEAYSRYTALMRRLAGALAPSWSKTIPGIGGNDLRELLTFAEVAFRLRRLGRQDMGEFLRIAALPMRDLLDEYFESDRLKAMLSWDGLIGSKMAPRSPNSAVLALLYRMGGDTNGMHAIPAGGIGSLVNALSAAAGSVGAEIRCSAEVDKIVVSADRDGLRATGVRLADGSTISADRIVSAADPKRTLLRLLGVEHLEIGFTNRVRRIRGEGLVGKLHLALDALPEIAGIERPDGRMIVADDMDAIEFAYDDAKYGEASAEPVIEVVLPSLHDTSLAPKGRHVLSAHVMYVPHARKGGWDDEARSAAAERAIDVLARHAPRIRELIAGSEFLTPADIEREYRSTGGSWHHGDFGIDQMLMMRPTYEAAQYRTPVDGLYLCSAGSHPGGDITGLAGRNAAREILR